MLKWFKARKKEPDETPRTDGRPDLEKLVEKITDIPTLPDIVFKVTEVINNPNSSAADLERTLSHDQAIVAKILKLVNSAYYRRREKIDTLSRAIPMLVFQNIRNLVFSMSLLEFSSDEIDMRAFWRHSFAASLIADEIANFNKIKDVQVAGCAALIHDIGKVILYQHFPGEFINVAVRVAESGITFYDAESEVFGLNHAIVGKLVLEKWGFPETLLEAVEFHHTPLDAKQHLELVAIVHLADMVSERQGYGFLTEPDAKTTNPELMERFLDGEVLRVKVERKLEKEMPVFETFIDKMVAFRASIEEHDRDLYTPKSVWTEQ